MRYTTVISMWRVVLLYTLGVNAVLYFLIGLIASMLHIRGPLKAATLTVGAALFGVVTAAVLGAVPSLLLAALYNAIPSDMSAVEAVVFGCAQGLVIAMLNAGFFHRLL